MDYELKDYQKDILNNIKTNIQNGNKNQLVCMPIGSGKTHTILPLIEEYLSCNKNVLVLYPTKVETEQLKSIINSYDYENKDLLTIITNGYFLSHYDDFSPELIIIFTSGLFGLNIRKTVNKKSVLEARLEYAAAKKNSNLIYFQQTNLRESVISMPIVSTKYPFSEENLPALSLEYRRVLKEKQSTTNDKGTIEEITKMLNESASCYLDESKKVLNADLREIQICFKNKAYKAAIILAGSVLEAFLIDWLSKIKNENYFEKDYQIQKTFKDGTPIIDKRTNLPVTRRAGLADYIHEIKILREPDWEIGSEQANEIRERRNMVHAKLFINEDSISKESCEKIINYLRYVIETRWESNNHTEGAQ